MKPQYVLNSLDFFKKPLNGETIANKLNKQQHDMFFSQSLFFLFFFRFFVSYVFQKKFNSLELLIIHKQTFQKNCTCCKRSVFSDA